VNPAGDDCLIIIGTNTKFVPYELSIVVHGRYVSKFAHFIHNLALTLEITVFTAKYNIKEINSPLTPCIYALRIPHTTNTESFPVQSKEFKHLRWRQTAQFVR
jgi:hypothetical protein